ncbi:MAG: putative bifunctional diguanylate cyclase/phosphodiesterase [Chloroflexota bacterium]
MAMGEDSMVTEGAPACPVAVSQLERILAAAGWSAARTITLQDSSGRLLAAAAPMPQPSCGAAEAEVEAEAEASAPVIVQGEVVATVRALGGQAAGMALAAATTAAAWIADLWAAAGEVDSLAGEIVRAYEELYLLYELGESLTSPLGVPTAADFVLQKIVHALHASWAEVRLADGSTRAIGQGEVVGSPAPPPAGRETPPGHHLATSLRSGGETVGTIVVGREPDGQPFSSVDGKLLDAVGTLAANAIRNAQLYQESRRQAEALREREAHLRAVMDNVADGIITLDDQGIIQSFNPAAEQAFGYTSSEVAGQHCRMLFPEPDAGAFDHDLWAALSGGEREAGLRRREAVGRRKDGATFPIDVAFGRMCLDAQRLSIISVRDITDRKRTEQRLAHQALHDSLTGLPNRALLHDRLQRAILVARRDSGALALLVMDLDRFKEVNDTFGHHYGDLLLRQVGARLQDCLRSPDTVARLGGDEFAVLLAGADAEGAVGTALRLLRALERPFLLEGQALDVGASIGIALCPDHGSDADTLLRRADVAMYLAKRSNSGYTVYDFDQDENSPHRLALVGDLRRAIERDELILHYQPKVGYWDNKVAWVEALVRWPHPKQGVLRPDEFIPLAEQTGLIVPLGLWVIDTALQQCRRWQDAGLQVPVAVNLSMRNLQDWDLPDKIARSLAARGVAPSLLKVEVTESSLMADPSRAMHVLLRLREMNVQVAIDDFGTGYSSLAYLKDLPVNEIKIDKSFVRHIATDRTDAAIVRSTIDLSHDLGLTVVAEGVEDRATWDLLASLGCDLAQGYYVSHPLGAAELTRWLHESAWVGHQRPAQAPDPAAERLQETANAGWAPADASRRGLPWLAPERQLQPGRGAEASPPPPQLDDAPQEIAYH